MNIKKSEYELQAETFLQKHDVTFKAEKAVPQIAPIWAQDGEHGICWNIELHKGDINGRTIQFLFWSSIAEKYDTEQANRNRMYQMPHRKPSAYDVLASVYMQCAEEGFKWFCDNLGYDEDSRKAYQAYEKTLELNEKLKSIFSAEALSELSEIQ